MSALPPRACVVSAAILRSLCVRACVYVPTTNYVCALPRVSLLQRFPELGRDDIQIDNAADGRGGLTHVMRSNALMYRDMSWGKLDWEETYVPAIYDSSVRASAGGICGGDSTKLDSIDGALADGYR